MDARKSPHMVRNIPDVKQPGIILFNADYKNIRDILSQSQKGDLLDALMAYGETGDLYTGNDPLVKMAFNVFSDTIRRMAEKYSYRCQINAKNIRSRWDKQKNSGHTTEYDCIRSNTNPYEAGETESQSENQAEAENEAEAGNTDIFLPPTIDEVSAYCLERGNKVNAEYFVNYHEARGWELKSGQKMKDWKAVVRTWEQNQKEWQNESGRTHEKDRIPNQRELYGL